jgi:hypothetical protein
MDDAKLKELVERAASDADFADCTGGGKCARSRTF